MQSLTVSSWPWLMKTMRTPSPYRISGTLVCIMFHCANGPSGAIEMVRKYRLHWRLIGDGVRWQLRIPIERWPLQSHHELSQQQETIPHRVTTSRREVCQMLIGITKTIKRPELGLMITPGKGYIVVLGRIWLVRIWWRQMIVVVEFLELNGYHRLHNAIEYHGVDIA